MNLLRIIEQFLRDTGMAYSRLGRDAVNDPRFVLDLRDGREPRKETRDRVLAFMEAHRGADL